MCRELRVVLRFLVFILYLVLAFCGGICIMYLAARPAHGMEKVVRCDPTKTNDRVKCEARGLPEARLHWETTLFSRLAQHESGLVVYLTLDNDWRALKVYAIVRGERVVLWDGFIRWNGKEVEFGVPKEKPKEEK